MGFRWWRAVWIGAFLGNPILLAQAGAGAVPVEIPIRPRPHLELPAQPLLRVDSSLVLIPVHVTNAWGASVMTLRRDAFRIFEDNAEQPIRSFVTEDAPVSVGILFDASGSMRDKMQKSCEAAAAFFQAANPEDEFFLIEFNDRARLVQPFTTDANEVYSRISHTRPYGRTSLLDAIFLGLRQMKTARHSRKALVIVSDGGDNWSRRSRREVTNALIESDVQVYAMGIYGTALPARLTKEERNGPGLLDHLTEQSGGRHFPVESLEDLPAISRRLCRELHNQYLIGYHSTNSIWDGKYRRVRVSLTLPDQHDLHISYRRGYYAPSE